MMDEQVIVTVIIVNFNGRSHLEPCIKSLLQQSLPAHELEIIVIDNSSHDGSQEFIVNHFPTVKLIQNSANIGFAGAVNGGAAIARGRYLALINNDAYADPHWLSIMVHTLEEHRQTGVVCIAATMLDWYGKHIDFVDGGINFYGHGVQFYKHIPVESLRIEQKDLLFACGGAMLVDRQVFLDVGGFDADYFAYFEDVDFGWRLWLLGYRVMSAPKAIVYHRQHATASRMYYHQVHMLSERNALFTLIKNYDDEHLQRILPIAYMLLMKRSLLDMDYTHFRQMFDLRERNSEAGDDTLMIPKVALSKMIAMSDVIDNFSELWAKRQALQARRVRSDKDIFPLFKRIMDVSHLSSDYAFFQELMTDTFDLRAMFNSTRTTRIVIISSDPLYNNLAGVGIRAVEMARHLANSCHVTLVAPEQADIDIPHVTCIVFKRDDPATLYRICEYAEVVLVHGYTLYHYPTLKTLNKILIVDIYDPFHLENLELHTKKIIEATPERAYRDLHVVNDQLMAGDFFICASERQRDFWLGALGSVGRLSPEDYQRDPTFRSLIDVASFGADPIPPVHQQPVLKGIVPGIDLEDIVVLWGGGIWDWLDPLTIIRAMALVAQQRSDVKLFFMGLHHPNPTIVPRMPMYDRAVALARELGLDGTTVFFNDHWVPYTERANYLLEADIGVSAHFEHVETRFAFRTRLLDYIWAGLPMIVSAGDTLADTVVERNLGQVVAVEVAEGFAHAILDLAARSSRREDYQADFAHAQYHFAWPQVLKPLIEFCRKPHYAADKQRQVSTAPSPAPTVVVPPPEVLRRLESVETTVAEKNTHIQHLENVIQRLENGRIMRGLSWIASVRQRLKP